MKPQTIGRVLGAGIRVAGRIAGERLAGQPAGQQTGPPQPSATVSAPAAAPVNPAAARKSGNVSGSVTGRAARGVGGFLKPFRRVGGIVFLEIVGVFFLLFVLVFGEMVWRMRASYAAGPDHWKFLAAAGLMLVFLYLTASSFWRARRR